MHVDLACRAEAPADYNSMAALDRALDGRWRADRDYNVADMDGSAVFLLAAWCGAIPYMM